MIAWAWEERHSEAGGRDMVMEKALGGGGGNGSLL